MPFPLTNSAEHIWSMTQFKADLSIILLAMMAIKGHLLLAKSMSALQRVCMCKNSCAFAA